jgi:hypothetical protein
VSDATRSWAGDFDLIQLRFRERTRDVLVAKTGGRPTIIMHEVFGLTQPLLDFARLLVEAGFKIYLPVLFGSNDPTVSKPRRAIDLPCVIFQFRVLARNDPGPWADWIRDLASFAYVNCEPGKGVGVIGLCLTGNLALSAALNPHVTAPVMCEPSLPFFRAGGLHVSRDELRGIHMRVEHEGLVIRGYRYDSDKICKPERFCDLEKEFGAGFQGTTIPTRGERLHSVFTDDLRDETGAFRHGELQTLIDYLRARI